MPPDARAGLPCNLGRREGEIGTRELNKVLLALLTVLLLTISLLVARLMLVLRREIDDGELV